MNINREKSVCFSGHRPERLHVAEDEVIQWLDEEIQRSLDEGYTTFISGMQRGIDIWAAEIVLQKKRKHQDIQLVAASAFPNMESDWEITWINRYDRIWKNANYKVYVCNHPSRAAYFKRNEWMVDHASKLIAVYNNEPGGTQKTIEYAIRNNLKVVKMPWNQTQ